MTDLSNSIHTIEIMGSTLTMRMARQLDMVGLTALDVIGRVRLGARRKPEKGFRLAIGTTKEDGVAGQAGTLALAAYRRYSYDFPWWIELAKEDKVTICSRARYDRIARYWVDYVVDSENPRGIWKLKQKGGLVLEIDVDNVIKCEADHFKDDEPCKPYWSCSDTVRNDIESQMQEGQAEQTLHKLARESPLIVLP